MCCILALRSHPYLNFWHLEQSDDNASINSEEFKRTHRSAKGKTNSALLLHVYVHITQCNPLFQYLGTY